MTTLRDAIQRAGSLRAFGASLGVPVSPQAVSIWLRQGWVPIAKVNDVVEKYGVDRDSILPPKVRAALS